MAKALLYRGIAYRQQKKPAQAIADLTSALWLKGGLGGDDRTDAMRQRASAYQEAGLADSGGPIAPRPCRAPRALDATASAEHGVARAPTAPPAPSVHRANAQPIGRRLAIHSPAGSAALPRPLPTRPRRSEPRRRPTTASIEASQSAPATAPAPGHRTSGWTRNTEVRGSARRSNVCGGCESTTVRHAAHARPEGRFRIQVGDGAHAGRGAGACGQGEARA